MIKKGIQILCFLTMFLTACVDIIDVDTSTEPSRLVVDGYITSEYKVHEVRLQETIKFSNDANLPVVGASVEIIGSDSSVIPLLEAETGYYYTNCCFAAQPGVEYHLRIVHNGKTVESTPASLPQKIAMQGISIKPEIRQLFREIDNSIADEPGFWVTTPMAKAENGEDYYLWQAVPTYIWEAPRTRDEQLRFCYVTAPYTFQDIYLHSETDGNYDRELLWVTASRDMQIRYSLEVTQYNLNKDAFDFWSRIKAQQENVGSIFDTPPSSIQGNLYNVNNPNDIVLGYFGVYELSSERIFLDLQDLPYDLYLVDVCASIFRNRPPECLDCRKNNRGDARIERPEWWTDK